MKSLSLPNGILNESFRYIGLIDKLSIKYPFIKHPNTNP